MKSAILYITHKESESVIEHFKKLKNDVLDNQNIDLYCIYDITNSSINESSPLNYNLIKVNKQIITDAGFTLRYYYISNKDFYGHNLELMFLYFYQMHPDYDYYWIIEYDVVFNGNWNTLLKIDECVKTDYICSNLKKRNAEQYYLRTYYTTINPKIKDIHAFNPIFRLSNRAFKLIYELYKDNNYGHYEHFFPSVILEYKYTITTFNDLGYVGGTSNNELKDSTMNYLHHYTNNELKINDILYHPLK